MNQRPDARDQGSSRKIFAWLLIPVLWHLAGCASADAPEASSPDRDTFYFRCAPAGPHLARLTAMGMKPVSHGIDREGDLFMVFADEGGTWVGAFVTAQGMYCPVAAGIGWHVKIEGRGV